MNELNINILRSPARSTVRRFLGVSYIVIGILWILNRIFFHEGNPMRFPLPILDIVFIIVNGTIGIIFIIEGSGKSISAWFGEAYIRINDDCISIKPGVFKKEWNLSWNEVEKIYISIIKIEFTLKNAQISELSYDLLEYEHIQAIKRAVKEFAKEKNISINE